MITMKLWQILICMFTVLPLAGPATIGCSQEAAKSGTDKDSINKQKSDSNSAKDAEHHYFHKTEKKHVAEWGYRGKIGPKFWGSLSPKYKLAKDGKQQSPIDISGAAEKEMPPIQFDYKPAQIDLVYNGHTIQETEEEGSSITVQGRTFALKQFHFHAPSEHTINGKHADMEMHLVHKDAAGRVAVVGVMINEGKNNSAFDPIWGHLPTEENRKQTYEEKVDAVKLLPKTRGYFHYMGSFTTPPCIESVFWYVLTDPVELSKEQINKFKSIISGNNRPVQPLNERTVSRTRK